MHAQINHRGRQTEYKSNIINCSSKFDTGTSLSSNRGRQVENYEIMHFEDEMY